MRSLWYYRKLDRFLPKSGGAGNENVSDSPGKHRTESDVGRHGAALYLVIGSKVTSFAIMKFVENTVTFVDSCFWSYGFAVTSSILDLEAWCAHRSEYNIN